MVNRIKVEWGIAAVLASLIIASPGYKAFGRSVLFSMAFFPAAVVGLIWGIIEIIQGIRENG